MIMISYGIYVGDETDYAENVSMQKGWAVVHACKEPYHRQAIGYTGRACSKDNPEYLIALRGNRLMLNLVDVEDPNWIAPIIVDTALGFINEKIAEGFNVLVHCNKGESRAAGIGMLYLASIGAFADMDFLQAEEEYKKSFYAPCDMAGGMRGYVSSNWQKYNKGIKK
jgi:hypothetical protein